MLKIQRNETRILDIIGYVKQKDQKRLLEKTSKNKIMGNPFDENASDYNHISSLKGAWNIA